MQVDVVTLKVAQALKAAGMPQTEFPQYVWIRHNLGLADSMAIPIAFRHLGGTIAQWTDWVHFFYYEPLDTTGTRFEWVAAPTSMQALTWLEEQGCQWHHGIGTGWLGKYPTRKVGDVSYTDWAADADGIILQLCEWLIAAAARKE